MAFVRNLSPYKRTNQPAFEESYKYWLEEELKKIERSVETMQDVYNPSYLGAFYDTTTQVAATVNTPQAVTFNNISYEYGVARGTPTSRIYFDNRGFYNLEFALQVAHVGSAAGSDVLLWVNFNGTPYPDSATRVHVRGANQDIVASWNLVGEAQPTNYVELMWQTTSVDTVLLAEPATLTYPAIPSARMSLTQIAK